MLPILAVCFASCEKSDTERTSGHINTTITYIGTCPLNGSEIWVYDIGQLDIIMTLTAQIHEICMNNPSPETDDLESLLRAIVPIYGTSGINASYTMEPGTYIVLARSIVSYSYSSGRKIYAPSYQYKIVQIESNKETSVAFVFQDYNANV